jgi:DNA-binding MarR family transcriptional regulator
MSEPLSIRDCNCLALRRAARLISNFYDSALAASGLRATQFAILALVQEKGEASVNEIAEKLALDRTTAGKNLKPLNAAKLITIAPSEKDARQRAVRVTRAGLARLKIAVPLWRKAQARFEAANGAQQAGELRLRLRALKFR